MSVGTRMTPGEIQEIRERVDKATPGPWVAGWDGKERESELGVVALNLGGIDTKPNKYGYANSWKHVEANQRFIAAARSDIPKLLSHIEEQQGEIERLNG